MRKKRKAYVRKPPEEMFGVNILCPDSQLGKLLRCTSSLKGVQVNGVLPIEERAAEKNLPKGAFKDAVIEVINKNGGSVTYDELKQHLMAMGFGKQRVWSGLGDAFRLGNLKRDRQGIVVLNKWKEA